VETVEPGVYRITSEPPARSGTSRALRWLGRTLIGPPIPTEREDEERLSTASALPVLGADSVASSVYGPEEMMRTLALAGAAALALTMPVALAIVALLAVLAISYHQTIQAYPSGAGAYAVAGSNLGPLPGLVAAAALLIDYALDVAVSVASGVQSLTSAVPGLAPWRIWIALGALAILTVANLRGIRASGLLFSAPIYIYILGTLGVVGYGLFLWATDALPPYEPPPAAAEQIDAGPLEALGLLLSESADGAWMVVVVLPLLVLVLRGIGAHNRRVDEQVALDPEGPAQPVADEVAALSHHILIPVDGLNRVALHGVAYALSLAGDRAAAASGAGADRRPVIEALYVTDDRAKAADLRERWRRCVPHVPLVVVESPYRAWVAAVLRYLDEVDRRQSGRASITTVLLPEAVPARWWQKLLHKPTAFQLKGALLFRPGTAVMSVPYHLAD
jgi:hypothetical protein